MPESTHFQTPNGRTVFISVESVQDALATLIHDHSKHATTVPLESLQLVEEWLLHPDLPAFEMSRAMAVQELLISLITAIHTEIRQAFGLSAAQPTETLNEVFQIIEANAGKSSPQLLIWDWFYYRYVRDDLTLSQDDFCKAAHIDERTLRRYQPRALKKLTERLIHQEWEVRSSQRRRRLLAVLPPPPATRLIERDAYINGLNDLLQTQPYAHILVSGAPGIGKTAVVRAVLQTQIAHDRFDQVVWLNAPPSLDFVLQAVRAHILPEISPFSLAECAAEYAIGVVIDDADCLCANAEVLGTLLYQLRGVTVFLIANAFTIDTQATLSIRLPELTQAGVRTLIEDLLRLYVKEDTEAYPLADVVWQHGGGNPSAVKLLCAAAVYDHFENETLEKIFAKLYDRLDAPLENILLLLSCLPPSPIPLDVLCGFCVDIRADQVVKLAKIGLIESVAGQQEVLLSTAMRQFIRARAYKDEHFAGKLNSVLALICNSIGTGAMDYEIAEHLLLENRVLERSLQRACIERYWMTGVQRGDLPPES